MKYLLKFSIIFVQVIFSFHVIMTQLIFPLEDYYIQGKDASFDYDALLSVVDYLEEEDYCEDPDGAPHCVWYRKCDVSTDDGGTKTVPCLDNCKGRNVTGADRENDLKYTLLHKFCPDFLVPAVGEDYPRVCCSIRTLLLLSVELSSYQGLLNRCPSCWENYRKFYCTLNCAPDQSVYMVVTNTTMGTYKPINFPTRSTDAITTTQV